MARDIQVVDDDMVDDGPPPKVAEEAEDIDPADWLSEDPGHVTERYVLSNGRAIKIAPITDAEELKIQKGSRRPDPQDPRRRIREFTVYKRMFIAESINKAYGRKLGDPKYVLPEQLANKFVGELTGLMTAIMNLSGMETTTTSTPNAFFD